MRVKYWVWHINLEVIVVQSAPWLHGDDLYRISPDKAWIHGSESTVSSIQVVDVVVWMYVSVRFFIKVWCSHGRESEKCMMYLMVSGGGAQPAKPAHL